MTNITEEFELPNENEKVNEYKFTIQDLIKEGKESYVGWINSGSETLIKDATGTIDCSHCPGLVTFSLNNKNWMGISEMEFTIKSREALNLQFSYNGIESTQDESDTDDNFRVINFNNKNDGEIKFNLSSKLEWTLRTLNNSSSLLNVSYEPDYYAILKKLSEEKSTEIQKSKENKAIHEIYINQLKRDRDFFEEKLGNLKNDLELKKAQYRRIYYEKNTLTIQQGSLLEEKNELVSENNEQTSKIERLMQKNKSLLTQTSQYEKQIKITQNMFNAQTVTLNNTYKHEIEKLSKTNQDNIVELKQYKDKIDIQIKDYATLFNKYNKCKYELDQLNRHINTIENEKTVKSNTLIATNNTVEDLRQELQNIKEELNDQKEEYDTLEYSLNIANTNYENKSKNYNILKEDFDDVSFELDSAKRDLCDKTKELQDTTDELNYTRDELDDTKIELQDIRVELEDIKVELNYTESELSNITNSFKTIEKRNGELYQLNNELEEFNTKAVQNAYTARKGYEKYEKAATETKKELDDTKDELGKMVVLYEDVTQELQLNKKQIFTLEKELMITDAQLKNVSNGSKANTVKYQNLTESYELLETKLNVMSEKHFKLQEKYEILQRAHAKLESEKFDEPQNSAQNTILNDRVNTLNADLNYLNSYISGLEKEREVLKQQNFDYKQIIDTNDCIATSLSKDMEYYQNELKTLKSITQMKEEECISFETEIQTKDDELLEKDDELLEKEEELKSIKEELNNLQSVIKLKDRDTTNLEHIIEQYKLELNDPNSNKYHSIIKNLKTDKEYITKQYISIKNKFVQLKGDFNKLLWDIGNGTEIDNVNNENNTDGYDIDKCRNGGNGGNGGGGGGGGCKENVDLEMSKNALSTDLIDFEGRKKEIFRWYAGQSKRSKDFCCFGRELQLLLNDVLCHYRSNVLNKMQ